MIHEIGIALNVAQFGSRHPNAKPWKSLGPGLREIVNNFATNTFRAVYVVRFEEAIYVLHYFQKKSSIGIRTAKTDVALVEQRLKAASVDYEVRYGKTRE